MPTPTKRKILERAKELFHHREGTSISPEESELKESGYMQEAKEDLMGTKKGSEAYSQQERYMQDMGNEMDLSVRPKGEMRLDKWRMRAYREAAMPSLRTDKSPKVVHFPSLSERA